MKRTFASLILLFLTVSVCLPISAVVTFNVKDINTSAWPKVTAECELSDLPEGSNPSFALRIDNTEFQAFEETKLQNHGEPINALFLVDISRSMDYAFSDMKIKMTEIAGLFEDNDTYSMMTFAEEIETVVSFSTNPAEVGLRMGEQEAKGGTTRLYDALIEANAYLGGSGTQGVIFLFTDGNDQGSKQKEVFITDFPIIPIIPSGGINRPVLQSLAEETHGFYMPKYDINRIKPSIIKWKGTNISAYHVVFAGLPEFEPPVEKKIYIMANVGEQFFESEHDLIIEKKGVPFWVWLISGMGILVALVMFFLWFTRFRVPSGKRITKKRVKGKIHFIAWLTLPTDEESQFRIKKDTIIIGSGTESDFVVDDPTVSYEHAKITETPEGFVLTDMDSASGTFINEESLMEPTLLRDEDKIRVGMTVIVFTQSDFAYVSKEKVI
ncbi:MAG TPA: FHA domain-containing protein [Caldisericia bacterium]|nr:FHA domain-containing protein [Caldisericia bacterium]HPF48911.1 FHA domain-containing protein [Caldisericia bacterium]HPI83225.1 FHA domain-containing protein [Caldisericia bacterium]HPQ92452.1 FHA domain-containing protein [Caldisericia bacterium]HRV74450.1 FHA domain-containing protein [Caldisericia bacterium]